MKESIAAILLIVLVTSFGSAISRPVSTDILADRHVGERLRTMILDGRVQATSDGRGPERRAVSGAAVR